MTQDSFPLKPRDQDCAAAHATQGGTTPTPAGRILDGTIQADSARRSLVVGPTPAAGRQTSVREESAS